MARVRFLKPGFFENAKLAKLSPHARLLFAGLWTIADKRGRLRDNGKWIAGSVFPHENVNVERLLKDLEASAFIQRYEIDDEKVIQVTNFERHQNPHHREAESRLPPPPLQGQSLRPSPSQSRADYGQPDYGQPDNRIPEVGAAKAGAPVLEPSEQKNIFRATERMFSRPLSPVECDALREMEADYPEETWRYAIREAGELNKRSVRYMQSVCRRVESGEDNHDTGPRNGTHATGGPAAGYYTDGTPEPVQLKYSPNPNRGRNGP